MLERERFLSHFLSQVNGMTLNTVGAALRSRPFLAIATS
jgi:hypothetical protein